MARMHRYSWYIGVALITFTFGGVFSTAAKHVWSNAPYRFHFAAANGDLATVRSMIANGTNVDLRDNFGETALIHASREGNTDIVTELLRNGAQVNVAS